MKNYTTENDIIRFWLKVNKDGSIPQHCPELSKCWEWIKCKNKAGYGLININHKMILAHRLSWELLYGEILDRLFVLHKCDNPACVNPDHLFLGTHQDNINDMVAKKRTTKGEKNAMSKLTQLQVDEIRNKYLEGATSQPALAKQYGIKQQAISRIVNRKRWC